MKSAEYRILAASSKHGTSFTPGGSGRSNDTSFNLLDAKVSDIDYGPHPHLSDDRHANMARKCRYQSLWNTSPGSYRRLSARKSFICG